MKPIHIYSSIHLEPWSYKNPWTKGIGGSETCHIELVERMEKRRLDVTSYCPLPDIGKFRKNWKHFLKADTKAPGNWLVFRDPSFFDQDLNPDNKYIFVAQDVDYPWSPERLAKVSKYVVLCQKHKQYTENRYPELKNRIEVSSNGVRSEYISKLATPPRNPNKIAYISSPDRGLELILDNWFRVIERCPEAELHVFYGFDNIQKLAQKMGGWYVEYPQMLLQKMKQPGIYFRGRMGQKEIYNELLSTNIWWYPTDWPETSCIACMDAQACGAIPVTNNYWALQENILHGYKTKTIPQSDVIAKIKQIDYIEKLIKNPDETLRSLMMHHARCHFDWERITNHYLEMLND